MPDLTRVRAIRDDVEELARDCAAAGLEVQLEEITSGPAEGFMRATVRHTRTGEEHEFVSGDPAKAIDRAMGAFKRKRGA